jgi:hypothetical protein
MNSNAMGIFHFFTGKYSLGTALSLLLYDPIVNIFFTEYSWRCENRLKEPGDPGSATRSKAQMHLPAFQREGIVTVSADMPRKYPAAGAAG